MNIVFDHGSFLKELSLLTSVVDRKVTIPVLSGVLLSATDGGAYSCVASNIDNTLRIAGKAESVAQPGSAVLPLDTVVGLLKQFPGGQCAVSVTKQEARLSAAGSSAKVPTFPLEDYPPLVVPASPVASIRASLLADLVWRVKHAMVATAHYPAGAFCTIGDEQLTIASFDGYRIHVAATTLGGIQSSVQFGISDRAWDALVKMLADEPDADVAVALAGNAVSWSTETRTLTSRIYDKEFPNYRHIMSNERRFVVTAAVPAVRSALKRHLVLATMEHTKVACRLESGQLLISSMTTKGAAEDVVRIEGDEGEHVFGVNPQYALDAVEALDAPRLRMSLAKRGHLLTFEPVDVPQRVVTHVATMTV